MQSLENECQDETMDIIYTYEEFENEVSLAGLHVSSEDSLSSLVAEDFTDYQLIVMINHPTPPEADIRPDPLASLCPYPNKSLDF